MYGRFLLNRTRMTQKERIGTDKNSMVMVSVYPPCFIFWREPRNSTTASRTTHKVTKNIVNRTRIRRIGRIYTDDLIEKNGY